MKLASILIALSLIVHIGGYRPAVELTDLDYKQATDLAIKYSHQSVKSYPKEVKLVYEDTEEDFSAHFYGWVAFYCPSSQYECDPQTITIDIPMVEDLAKISHADTKTVLIAVLAHEISHHFYWENGLSAMEHHCLIYQWEPDLWKELGLDYTWARDYQLFILSQCDLPGHQF